MKSINCSSIKINCTLIILFLVPIIIIVVFIIYNCTDILGIHKYVFILKTNFLTNKSILELGKSNKNVVIFFLKSKFFQTLKTLIVFTYKLQIFMYFSVLLIQEYFIYHNNNYYSEIFFISRLINIKCRYISVLIKV